MSAAVKTWTALALALLLGLAGQAAADHDKRKDKKKDFGPVTDAAYLAQCGACHFAYQPELLPARSWEAIIAASGDHFGESLDIPAGDQATIKTYLTGRAADRSGAKRARKIMASLGGSTPRRVSEVPYLREKHHELSPQVLARKSVGGLNNCPACHRTAQEGDYDDDNVRVPD